ncbi:MULTISPECIES: TetR/AcrR family transcriptional regulator [Cellulomonas]|uniref:TetR/AcrR family transcriptional regulator n=1 Tax=Cellulomonas TaxID=1707 RepID=UPI001B9A9126|nr:MULTISPECIES: TetR/AcrR family transcriptional regulator [Cellulomonas]VTR77272.1 HTH-type transcriptional repressor BepR [Cellulomonas hominis]
MGSPKRSPRPRPETLERRRRILRAAMTTFGSKGYNNGPLTEIAEQVDMTHAGILHHFGSKDQLLVEVLRYRDETDVEGLAEQRIPDGIELFRHLVRTAFANEQRPGIVQTYAVLSAESVTDDHPGRAYFEDRYRTLRGEIAAAFRVVCEARGIEAPDTVDRAAASILAVMDGLQVQWLLARDDVELARASEFAIEALVSAVVQPAPAVVAEG